MLIYVAIVVLVGALNRFRHQYWGWTLSGFCIQLIAGGFFHQGGPIMRGIAQDDPRLIPLAVVGLSLSWALPLLFLCQGYFSEIQATPKEARRRPVRECVAAAIRHKKIIAKWILGGICTAGIVLSLEGWSPNYIAAVIWCVLGSVSYYSGLRWLWLTLL